MPLLANLDMEYALDGAPARKPADAQRAALCARWAHILRLLPDHDGPHLIPWGVTDAVLALAPDQPWPSPRVVAIANSKATSHAIEQELGCALPHSALVHDEAALVSAVAAMPHRWVLKHPQGVSGRERVRGEPGVLEQRELAWARRMWAGGGALVLEPWVTQAQETSLHYVISPDQQITLIGWATMLADRTGTLRGHRVSSASAPPAWEPTTRAAVARVAALGYHGPVSVDTMVGWLGEAYVERPITEINARYTFGRMAVELTRFAPPGATIAWHHPPASAPVQTPPTPLSPDAATVGLYRLPDLADPGGASGTYVEIEALGEAGAS